MQGRDVCLCTSVRSVLVYWGAGRGWPVEIMKEPSYLDLLPYTLGDVTVPPGCF